MNLAILGGRPLPRYYDLLDKQLNILIEESKCYLFTILCGRVEGQEKKEKTLAQLWATNNGAPVRYFSENTVDKLVHTLFLKADYIIFILDGDPFINNLFMRYKMSGKHGSVIRV